MDRSRYPLRRLGLQLAGFGALGLVWLVLAMDDGAAIDPRATLPVHAGMAVFAAGFLLGDRLPTWRDLHPGVLIQALAALVVLYLVRHSAAAVLLIVVVAQAPFSMGMQPAAALVILVNLATWLILYFAWGVNFTSALVTTLLYGTFQLFALLVGSFALSAEAARTRLTEVNAELLATRSLLMESARDRERLRLSRELHDVAGHTLTALKLNLRSLSQSPDEDSRQLAEQSLILADSLLEEVRALVGNFRSNDGLAIAGAIEQLTAPFPAPRFELAIDEDTRVEDLEAARTLISVAREAITNVVRHADASCCRIGLDRVAEGLRLVVEDDGRGVHGGASGHGLRGMTERMEAVGGSLAIEDREPRGTRVTAIIGAHS